MKFYKNFIVVWTIFYFVVAIAGRLFSPDKEYFPFFRWSLYSKTPNKLVHPYVMVSRFGEENFPEPIDVTSLKDYHKIGKVDMNLNVYNFYDEIFLDKNKHPNFLNLFPSGSEFIIYEKRYDLSQKDYNKTLTIKKIASYQNNQLIWNE